MRPEERAALASARIGWAITPEDIWTDLWTNAPFHVPALHAKASALILDGIDEARISSAASPLGIALIGQSGSGKSHLLGWVRQQIQESGGYFLPIYLFSDNAFWRNAALSLIDGLQRRALRHPTQLQQLLDGLTTVTGTPDHHRQAVQGKARLTRPALDTFVEALRAHDRSIGLRCQHTARALVLMGSDDFKAQDIGYGYLSSLDGFEIGELDSWGIRGGLKTPQEIVQELSILLALTGPTVIAVDQIDTLIAQSAVTTGAQQQDTWQQGLLLEHVAGGLMTLRELSRRTLTVVACLPTTWHLITTVATGSARDRFRESERLSNLPNAQTAVELVEKRLGRSYSPVGFSPPYRTWPIRIEAFDEAVEYTPRQLLVRVDGHIRQCLLHDDVLELRHLNVEPFAARAETTRLAKAVEGDLERLDAEFARLRGNVDIAGLMSSELVDTLMPPLLAVGLQAWITELGEEGKLFAYDPPVGSRLALHARLRQTLDEAIVDERHWSFRAVPHDRAIAVINRVTTAMTIAGLSSDVPKRRLFLIRNTPWPQGPKGREVLDTFHQAGGLTLTISDDDLKTLRALQMLLTVTPPALDQWLQHRRPAHNTAIFRSALDGSALASVSPHDDAGLIGEQRLQGYGERFTSPPESSLLIGQKLSTHSNSWLSLDALRQHVAIFAGSGSGKTQLLRRIVEEAALQGVSSVVLDANNDLARLGEPWPASPDYWGPDDQGRADRFFSNTDVVIWTPRRAAGRDLRFDTLPATAALAGDELDSAVEATMALLSALAKCDSETARAVRSRAVLREALMYYLRNGGQDLAGLLKLLADLPSRVSNLDNADKIATDLAHTLTAAIINDPVLSETDSPHDLGVLLTPPPGKTARISIITLIGLPSERQRQTLAYQLHIALCAWIKDNPAGEQPVRALLIMDDAQSLAPRGTSTATTLSTLALASQGRKYGLGLILSCSAPRGLHERVPANAATHLIGLMNSPAQIATAMDLAQHRGGDISNISQLPSGHFYSSVEGRPFELVKAFGCLSHHPSSPLTTEEILARAHAADIVPPAHSAPSTDIVS